MGLDLLTGILILLCSGLRASSAVDWTYWGELGPKNWPGVCSTGKMQSPINIVTDDAMKVDLGALKFDRYDFAFTSTLLNDGHSVQIVLKGVPIHLSGSILQSVYILKQMHFHWDAEHTVDGERDPLELHLVHYDQQYGNFSNAARHENGIAVVAVLFKLNSDDNRNLIPIVEATKMVSHWVGKNAVPLTRKLIPFLLLPKDHTTYYHYQGSLTTPECQESVMWFVMTEKLAVSDAQMSVFRHVEGNNGLLKFNYRPTQELGNRNVYHRLDGYTSSDTSALSSTMMYTFLNILLVKFL